jgi:hypothetical protein
MPLLSARLQVLASWWDEVLEQRAEFTVEGAKAFASEMHQAVEDAQDMERAATPTDVQRDLDRIDQALAAMGSPNVIPFPRRHA